MLEDNRARSVLNQVVQSDALQQLQRGDISLDAYLELCIDLATRGLVGLASPERIEFVRESLRAQLVSDPVLVQYVRETTGDNSYAA